MRRLRPIVLLLAVLLPGCATARLPAIVSVCELYERPSKFDGREVLLEAEVTPDLHLTRFVDSRCKGQGLQPVTGNAPVWDELEAVLRGDTSGRVVSGRFKGTVRTNGTDVAFELREIVRVTKRPRT